MKKSMLIFCLNIILLTTLNVQAAPLNYKKFGLGVATIGAGTLTTLTAAQFVFFYGFESAISGKFLPSRKGALHLLVVGGLASVTKALYEQYKKQK